jgi:hypothetical protein
MYIAITDDATCQICLKNDLRIMTGEEAERAFPNLLKGPNDFAWYCRCVLILLEAGF